MTDFNKTFEKYAITELLAFNGLDELPKELKDLALLKSGALPFAIKEKAPEGDFLKEGCKILNLDYEEVKKLLLAAINQPALKTEKKWFEFMEDNIFNIFKQGIKNYPVDETAESTQKPYSYLTMYCKDFVVDGFQIGLAHNEESDDWESMGISMDDFEEYFSLRDDLDTKGWVPTEEELDDYCDSDESIFFEILEGSLCEILFDKVGEKLKNDIELQSFITPKTKVRSSVFLSYIPLPFTSMPEDLRNYIGEQLIGNEESKIMFSNMWEDK